MRQIPFDLVLARSKAGGIGFKGQLPWKLPGDLQMFKKITSSGQKGNTVIMGRKTFESIGRPLPNRLNVVLSQSGAVTEGNGVRQAKSLQDALELSRESHPEGRIFVVGGSRVFDEGVPHCRHVYETLVADKVECDTFVSKYDHLKCSYISKTHRQNDLRYDYRLYHQPDQAPPSQNLFGQPQHEEYQYLRAIERIINEGQDRSDRTGTGTRALFGGMMRYDLNQTFPLLTHKRVFWRGVAQELLWFVKGATDADELAKKDIRIWDGNSSKEYLNSIGIDREAGDLGPVYGFQWRHWNAPYTDRYADYSGKGIDQLGWIINEIKKNPSSRRLVMSAWNPSQMPIMALPPCHLLAQFQVSTANRLNCILYQRSCDMGLGVPFNIASYSLLTCLVAQVTGLGRGELIHMMGDMHVYNDHIQHLKPLKHLQPHAFPYLHIEPSIKNIDDFRFEHLRIDGYASHKKITMKMSV